MIGGGSTFKNRTDPLGDGSNRGQIDIKSFWLNLVKTGLWLYFRQRKNIGFDGFKNCNCYNVHVHVCGNMSPNIKMCEMLIHVCIIHKIVVVTNQVSVPLPPIVMSLNLTYRCFQERKSESRLFVY